MFKKLLSITLLLLISNGLFCSLDSYQRYVCSLQNSQLDNGHLVRKDFFRCQANFGIVKLYEYYQDNHNGIFANEKRYQLVTFNQKDLDTVLAKTKVRDINGMNTFETERDVAVEKLLKPLGETYSDEREALKRIQELASQLK